MLGRASLRPSMHGWEAARRKVPSRRVLRVTDRLNQPVESLRRPHVEASTSPSAAPVLYQLDCLLVAGGRPLRVAGWARDRHRLCAVADLRAAQQPLRHHRPGRAHLAKFFITVIFVATYCQRVSVDSKGKLLGLLLEWSVVYV